MEIKAQGLETLLDSCQRFHSAGRRRLQVRLLGRHVRFAPPWLQRRSEVVVLPNLQHELLQPFRKINPHFSAFSGIIHILTRVNRRFDMGLNREPAIVPRRFEIF